VIMAWDSETMAGKDFRPADGQAVAPVILLGVSGSLFLDREAWQALPEANPGVNALRQALQVCLKQVGLMRHMSQTNVEREDFLSFLGHEMRSPLTSAKTALEVLQGDLGGLGEPAEERDPRLKMLEIALRSVRRMHDTVEWSQDLMGLASVSESVVLRNVEAPECVEILKRGLPLEGDLPGLPSQLHTDPEALAQLMDQIARAMTFSSPESRPTLTFQPADSRPNHLCLVLTPSLGARVKRQPKISRLGLASPDSSGSSVESELERLMGFMVSQVLVSNLGVDLEIRQGESQNEEVLVRVPLVPANEDSRLADGQLLPAF
jgi:His Kinase A (phospho-acceptor) domain